MSALPHKKDRLDTGYVLESEQEFERLERQSTFAKYDYRKELEMCGFQPAEGARILDAGCGSGVVSRYLASKWPRTNVLGCDFATGRIRLAAEAGKHLLNLRFEQGDLSELKYGGDSFDAIISRYVLQHLAAVQRPLALLEMKRCLVPGGTIAIIDFDGAFHNIHPLTPLMSEVLAQLAQRGPVDLMIGRKLPAMLLAAGFVDVRWQIETIECQGAALIDEIEMVREKLEAATAFMSAFLGSPDKAKRFNEEYLETMRKPEVVLFYNKFMVTALKPREVKLRLVKK